MKPGRNDPCPCGSGRKFKKCCEGKPEFGGAATAMVAALSAADRDALVALFNAGRHAELETRTRSLLERYPESGFAWKVLGAALQAQGKDALSPMERARTLLPDDAEAHNNLGAVLKTHGQLDEAAASFRRALEIKPDYAEAHSNLGTVLQDFSRLDDAVTSYRRALAIKPGLAEVHGNLGNALNDLGQFDEAAASMRRALEINPDSAVARSNLLFAHNYKADLPAAMLLDEARQFGALVTRQARPHTDWRNPPYPGRCLRVGLVSADLRNHAVGFFLEGMLAALASRAAGSLELIAYPCDPRTDELTDRIKSVCHDWRPAAGLGDEALARQIRNDGIDILIDLAGHTAHNRLPLFAWKPAPVQLSWLGYFATTGVAQIDYLLADPHTLPPGEECHFTETVWRLPETRLCFTAPAYDIPVGPLPALANGCISFGCFNHLAKMNDAVVALWSRILLAVPGSRLLLKNRQLADAGARDATLARFAAHGIGAARLILEGPSARAEYLAAYQRVDLALDPFPYPGGTTSVEGLWMGVPMLSLALQSFLSRQGVGILMNAGLPNWIATDAEDYVARAIAHARDIPRLAALRCGLRQTVLASPLFDAPRFAGHFEAALRAIWSQWCSPRR